MTRVEGELNAFESITVRIDNHALGPRFRPRLGRAKLTVEEPGLEPFETNVMVWYGINNFGEINLRRSRGNLEIRTEPAAREIQIQGSLLSQRSKNATATFSSIPVGDYHVKALFLHSSEERAVRVDRNQTARLEIKPSVGTLELTSEPAGSEFTLTDDRYGGIHAESKTPAALTELPSGSYRIHVWRGDYAKDLTAQVRAGQTNRLNVAFEYGEVKLITEPPGAAISSGYTKLGETPMTLTELKPGQYRLHLEKEGYNPITVDVELRGKDSIVVTTNLVNRRYAESIERARSSASPNFGNYRTALASVEEALKAAPGDPTASKLKKEIQVGLSIQEAKDFLAHQDYSKALSSVESALVLKPNYEQALNLKNEIAQAKRSYEEEQRSPANRSKSARQYFDSLLGKVADQEYFDLNVWKASAGLSRVREALLRYVEKGPDKWTLASETKVEERALVFKLDPKGTFSDRKTAFVHVCELADNETEIRCKILIYTVGKGFEWVPAHPKFYFPEDPNIAKAWRERVTRRFKENLTKELGSELK